MTGSHDPATPRRAAHAGTFYPASPEAVAALVDQCVDEAAGAPPSPAITGPLLGILVPHAGLVYSGRFAARAWSCLVEARPETVVIAGTNHVAGWVSGAAVWPAGEWFTPGASTPIDDHLAARILELGADFEADREAHRREHAIEVQLPFLARLLPRAAIVPISVSFDSVPRCGAAGAQLGALLAAERAAGRRVVLAISTDFAHYPSDVDARTVGRRMLEAIVAFDPEELGRREVAARRSRIPGLACGMCGIDATVFGLAALRALGANLAEVLAEGTSADVPFGAPDRTVGYAAVAFS